MYSVFLGANQPIVVVANDDPKWTAGRPNTLYIEDNCSIVSYPRVLAIIIGTQEVLEFPLPQDQIKAHNDNTPSAWTACLGAQCHMDFSLG